jgi:hypothetical protein
MNLKEWLYEKEFSFHRIETLIFLLVSAGLLLMKVIIPFVNTYTSNWIIHLIIFSLLYISIVGYWYYNRMIFPKNKEGKQHIIVAIITENAKQKTRITSDFANQIKKQIKEFDLDGNYDVTVLHNYQSSILQKRLDLYVQSLKAELSDSIAILRFNKLIKRLNAKFIIYGDLIKRNTENSMYCLSIDAMILHSPTDRENGVVLHEEFKKLWNKEITFLEKEELTGFKTNANQIFFTASYMLGLATFVDNNYLHGIKIWEQLESYIHGKPELSVYSENVKKLKSSAYFVYSRFLYFNGDIENSITFRNKYLELFPNDYDKYLNEAIKQIKIKNDPELALDFVRKAQNIAPNDDGTWRYSEFYLLIQLLRCDEALLSLDDILTNSFRTEVDVINQVISYNTTCLEQYSKHLQTHFIIGALLYKKFNLPIQAYEKLDEFVKLCSNNNEYKPLLIRAKEYLSEINILIGINN